MNEYQLLREVIKEKDVFITNILEEMSNAYNELCAAKQSIETLKHDVLKFLDEIDNNEQS